MERRAMWPRGAWLPGHSGALAILGRSLRFALLAAAVAAPTAGTARAQSAEQPASSPERPATPPALAGPPAAPPERPGSSERPGPPGWLGIGLADLTPQEAARLGLPQARGALITGLAEGTPPAAAVGLRRGDIITAVDGADLPNAGALLRLLRDKPAGTALRLAILRNGEAITATATLGTRPPELASVADSTPRLMLDTGGHMAKVSGIAFTPDGKRVVSAAADKTIRVWNVATGQTERMIRGEAAAGNWGTIYAMTLSPDGRWLAVGGYLHGSDAAIGGSIRLYDFASGELAALLKGHDNVVRALAFSSDGERLVSGSADRTAIVWDVPARRPMVRLSGHSDEIHAVAFTRDRTRVVTGSADETLRLWSSDDGRLIAEMTEHKAVVRREAQKPELWRAGVEAVAISPTDLVIASGSADGRILLWDGRTGMFMRQLAFPGGMVGLAAIRSLQFSPDGWWLLSASDYEGCQILDPVSGGELFDGVRHPKPLTSFDGIRHARCNGAAVFSPDGNSAAAAYNSQIQILDTQTGKARATLQGSGSPVYGVGFTADGSAVAWGETTDKLPDHLHTRLTRELRLPVDGTPLAAARELDPAAAERVVRGSARHGSWSLAYKRVGNASGVIDPTVLQISRDGSVQAEIALAEGGSQTAVSFAPDGQTVLVGVGRTIQAYGLDGHLLGSFAGHDGTVRDIAPSPDGRLLVSGATDQTVRLWNLETRELIASAYAAKGDSGRADWVVWTPQGYYASSPDGDRIVGWQINRGADTAADYVTASQLRDQFYRPEVVERAISLGSIRKATEDSGSFRLASLAGRPPPRLSILSPVGGSETGRGRATLTIALAEAGNDPIASFDAFVNETRVAAAARREGARATLDVPLAQGTNRIRVVARSGAGLTGEAALEVTQNGEGALDKRDRLIILAIGVDKYPQVPHTCGARRAAPCDLRFAGADAVAFADTIERQMGRQHREVIKRVLVNGAGGPLEPTRDNIENAFDLMLDANDNDTVAVFIAGHGYNDARSGYQFLPTDVRPGETTAWASSSVIKWTTLEGAIGAAKGRRLLFVDTCRSGGAYNARLIKDASDAGIVVYASTNTQQDALELASLGHGVFTDVLIKGLNGAADVVREREVRVFDLGAFVEREVRKLTGGRQTPDFYKKPGADNFVLVRM